MFIFDPLHHIPLILSISHTYFLQEVPVGHEGRTAEDIILRLDIQEREDMIDDIQNISSVVCTGKKKWKVVFFVH